MAGETEFSIDLARRAVADCLAGSRHGPEDVDLVIASSISRCDGPHFRFTFEPCTAARLQEAFGFARALAFDVSSACTGMFTAIHVADTLIKLGLARCALVVSGEYITHLTRTAQPVIKGFMDARLACLTLGDAGAAVLLEPSPDETVGFHALELFTLGRYANFCVGKAADNGPAMFTESIRTTEVAVLPAAMAALEVLQRAGGSVGAPRHVIMHQTSRTTLRDATRVIQNAFPGLSDSVNVVDNLAERGNTASTSHFVALMDEIVSGRIRSGDGVVFGVSGSGQTVGAGLYTFDDLPDRVRRRRAPPDAPRASAPAVPGAAPATSNGQRVRIEAIGTVPGDGRPRPTLELCRVAAENCLAGWAGGRSDLGLVLHAGVYRSEYLFEPAIASMIAGALGINDVFDPMRATRTLAFDVFNGAVGFLQACFVAAQTIRAGKAGAAMVVASEVEGDDTVLEGFEGCAAVGSAVILAGGAGDSGFGRFVFRSFPEHGSAVRGHASCGPAGPRTFIRHEPGLEEIYLARVPDVVGELLEAEGLDRSEIKIVFPPQISTAFIARLAESLGMSSDRCVDAAVPARDLFTSSLPYALAEARRRDLVGVGDVGLIIAAGSGLQIGCALYRF
jgi:3-oxoacyl-[acyl-carrier-protein] synthase III